MHKPSAGMWAASIITLITTSPSAGRPDGTQRYTPTALEWLTMYCTTLGKDRSGYFSTCDAKEPNTIEIRIGYWDKSLKRQAEDEFIPISFLVKKYAEQKGWDWLRLEKTVEFIQQK